MQASALWIPPVSTHDEITNIGFSLAIIEILEMIGLLVAKKDKHDHASLHLPEDINQKTVYFCADGLTLDRMKSLKKRLIDVKHSFQSNYSNAKNTKNALYST